MTYTSFLPPDIYRFLFTFSSQRKLSVKEVELAFLRKAIKEHGWQCKHENIRYAKSNNLPYCGDCYQRMIMTRPPRYAGKVMLQQGTFEEVKDCIQEIEILK